MSARLLDPGFDLTLRPMRYPQFYEMYRDAIRNTWTVEEVDFATDVQDLRSKLSDAERHLVQRLVAIGRLDALDGEAKSAASGKDECARGKGRGLAHAARPSRWTCLCKVSPALAESHHPR